MLGVPKLLSMDQSQYAVVRSLVISGRRLNPLQCLNYQLSNSVFGSIKCKDIQCRVSARRGLNLHGSGQAYWQLPSVLAGFAGWNQLHPAAIIATITRTME